MKKRVDSRKKKYLYFVLFIAVIALGAVTFTAPEIKNIITSAATSGTTSLSLTINAAPVINVTTAVASQSITEAGYIDVTVNFSAYDSDGLTELVNSSARLAVNFSNEATRINSSCTPLTNAYGVINYSCTVKMWYFDGSGNWTINVSIQDTNGVVGENSTTSFELLSTTAMVMTPTALTWPTIAFGSTNQTASNDPIIINNTGNRDISAGNVQVTGYNLQGTSTTTDFIKAVNFSVWHTNNTITSIECNGTSMLNNTAVSIGGANVTAGNNTLNYYNTTSGQEQLYFCLRAINASISRQTYDTSGTGSGAWTIEVIG